MKKALNIIGGVICGIICIILFFLQIGFMCIVPAKSLITKDSIKDVINSVNIQELISKNPKDASDIYGAFDSLGFDVEETNEILDSESFKEFLNTYVYGNITNILDNEDIKLEYEDIQKLIEDIEKEKGIVFENKDEFLKLVKEKYSDIKEEIDISNNINTSTKIDFFGIIKFLASSIVTIIFTITFAIIYLKMCLFRWSFYKPLIWYGVTTIISSVAMLQGFLGLSFVNIFSSEKVAKYETVLKPAVKTFRTKGTILSSVMLVIGILMVVGFYYINKKKKENDPNDVDTKLENL